MPRLSDLSWTSRFLLTATLSIVPACGDDGGTDATASATTDGGTTATSGSGSETETGSETSSGTMGTTGADACEEVFNAIVTDIDETLTTADSEWIMQVTDGTYDPLARAGSLELIQGYADRGFRILYLTARPETVVLDGTGESAADATQRWLEEHGFPLGARTEIQLAPSFVAGDAARDYKSGALMERQAAGWMFDYAYGNATTDIDGYDAAGISKATTFIIGEEAGTSGTVAIDGEDWIAHNAAHLPTVDALCMPSE